ncbi:MAG: carbonic anhydrase family protein [Pseudomonadota bacterium]
MITGIALSAGAVPAWARLDPVPYPLYRTQNQQSQEHLTPAQALQKLKEGNQRFRENRMLQRNLPRQVEDTAKGQYPFAAMVACIDSRTSTEVIFDQGLGDVFAARVAGNFVNDDILGSLEFACAIAGAVLIVVLGHTACGAIRGACDDVVFGNLTHTLANLKPAVAAVEGFEDDRSSANPAFVQAVADKNVLLTMARIRQRSPVLRDLIDAGEVGLVGAMYDVSTGEAVFQ